MKILRIIPTMDPKQGGPCQGIRNSIPAMAALGVENEVVCFDEPNAPYSKDDVFPIHGIGKAKSGWGYNPKLVPWLLDNFANFDAVIVHGLWLYHSHAAIKAIKKYRKSHEVAPKVYVMPHGMLDPYFQKAKERKLKALRNELYWKLIENGVVNHADGVLFTCEEELQLARTTFKNYRPKREINVGYGIQPPPEYRPAMKEAFVQKVPNWDGKPFMLFLSRVHHKKGVDLLIASYLKLEKEIENLPQLVIAGPGLDQEFGKQMVAMASKSSNILFPGMLGGDAKWGAFYSCEAFVLPSHQENFGIAVVEAMACAKPVLVSNKVNIWREISSGQDVGGIVEEDTAGNTHELLMKWLGMDASQKSQMANAAYKIYQERFTVDRASQSFLKGINLKQP